MSLVINKLHFDNENENNVFNYYSIRLIKNDEENEKNDSEILKLNRYLYSLSETPEIQEFPNISEKYKFSDAYRIKLKLNNLEKVDLTLFIDLIIKSLIDVKYIDIYRLSFENKIHKLNKDDIENKNETEYKLHTYNEYIFKSKFINISLFYQIIYSICKKLKIDIIIMFDKNNAYKLDLNNDKLICSNEKVYNINDYKNIANEYSNICDAYINDIKSELYLKQ